MTGDHDRARARQQAAEDLEDIAALSRNPNFTRYFVRRLNQKRDTLRDSLENDPPQKVDKDEREIIRRLILAHTEILGMMAQDERSARMAASENVRPDPRGTAS